MNTKTQNYIILESYIETILRLRNETEIENDLQLCTVTKTASYATTSFKDAQIQYVPYRLDDVPMPMIDIQLPFNNHSHIVTWLDPSKMRPKVID